MYNTIILPLAIEDIREAAVWYNKQRSGLGKRFTNEVRSKVHKIKLNPKGSKVRYKNVRTVVLNVFPFMIHYSIEEIEKTVIIYAVLHTSRNPKLWKRRRKV